MEWENFISHLREYIIIDTMIYIYTYKIIRRENSTKLLINSIIEI